MLIPLNKPTLRKAPLQEDNALASSERGVAEGTEPGAIKRGMARIAGRSRQDTRRAALDASRAAFGELGLAGASLTDIAVRAGVTPATLCHHFGGKQGIYEAVTDEVYRELGSLASAIDPGRPLGGQVVPVRGRGR